MSMVLSSLLNVSGAVVWCRPVLKKNAHGASIPGASLPSGLPLWVPEAA